MMTDDHDYADDDDGCLRLMLDVGCSKLDAGRWMLDDRRRTMDDGDDDGDVDYAYQGDDVGDDDVDDDVDGADGYDDGNGWRMVSYGTLVGFLGTPPNPPPAEMLKILFTCDMLCGPSPTWTKKSHVRSKTFT